MQSGQGCIRLVSCHGISCNTIIETTVQSQSPANHLGLSLRPRPPVHFGRRQRDCAGHSSSPSPYKSDTFRPSPGQPEANAKRRAGVSCDNNLVGSRPIAQGQLNSALEVWRQSVRKRNCSYFVPAARRELWHHQPLRRRCGPADAPLEIAT